MAEGLKEDLDSLKSNILRREEFSLLSIPFLLNSE